MESVRLVFNKPVVPSGSSRVSSARAAVAAPRCPLLRKTEFGETSVSSSLGLEHRRVAQGASLCQTVLPWAKGNLGAFEISREADTLGTFLIASNLRNGIRKKGSATGAADKDSAGETVANVSRCPSAQPGPCQERLRASRLSKATRTPVHAGLWGFQALSPHSLGGFLLRNVLSYQSLQPFLPQLAFQWESGMSWG